MLLESYDKKQVVDFMIPSRYKKIVLSVSGGADSALMLYLTVKYLINSRSDATLSVMTLANADKLNWNVRRAALVIDYVLRRSGFENFDTHYSFYRKEDKSKSKEESLAQHFPDYIQRLGEDNKADLWMHGTTRNPPKDVKVTSIDGKEVLLRTYPGNVSKRNESEVPMFTPRFDAPTKNGNTFIHQMNPWQTVNKKFIADQYKKYGLTDTLLPLTRSCESRPEMFFKDYDKRVGPNIVSGQDLSDFETPCGKCWWCLERKWAFGSW